MTLFRCLQASRQASVLSLAWAERFSPTACLTTKTKATPDHSNPSAVHLPPTRLLWPIEQPSWVHRFTKFEAQKSRGAIPAFSTATQLVEPSMHTQLNTGNTPNHV